MYRCLGRSQGGTLLVPHVSNISIVPEILFTHSDLRPVNITLKSYKPLSSHLTSKTRGRIANDLSLSHLTRQRESRP